MKSSIDPAFPETSAHHPAQPGGWRLEQSYASLPPLFYRLWKLAPVREPKLVVLNNELASDLGLDPDWLARPESAAIFAGNEAPPGAQPLAQAYAGHQFGHFTGLGDGRALLLGEQVTPDERRFDIQLKGSGRTPFSRGGDGRAALGPMLREYLISEAMDALGIPTTRSLAVATTGEAVVRQEGPLPGAVLTRVAASHIRVGTFEWAAAHRDNDALKALITYTLNRHYPERANAENPAFALLEGVIERQARLIAQWMLAGFIHGVMNTDNMALSGETIDYGPCAFMDAYDPATVFSSIDHAGRYAYQNQPGIAQWNLARFAETLMPMIDSDQARALERAEGALHRFAHQFQQHWLTGFRAKLGLFTQAEEDEALAHGLLKWMHETRSDFTNTFRALSKPEALQNPPYSGPAFHSWHASWLARLNQQPQSASEVLQRMRAHNPTVIPRNHQVEAALAAAVEQNDLAPFHRLREALAQPFDHNVSVATEFLEPSPSGAPPYRTFCGT